MADYKAPEEDINHNSAAMSFTSENELTAKTVCYVNRKEQN
jgi:hypothetical protein